MAYLLHQEVDIGINKENDSWTRIVHIPNRHMSEKGKKEIKRKIKRLLVNFTV